MNTFIAAVLPWLQAFLYTVLSAVVPLAVAKGAAYLTAKNVDTTVYQAITRAGGVAFSALQASGASFTDKTALAAAADAGKAYLLAQVPQALAAKGVTDPAAVGALAGAELARLLALKTVAPAAPAAI